MKTNRLLSLGVGEFVRFANVQVRFLKDTNQFTDEIFNIIDMKTTKPRVSYELTDPNREIF